MFPFPAETLNDTYVPAFPGDFALCISSTAKHVQEAKAFISFMVRKENARYFAEKDGSPSCITDVDYIAPELIDQNNYLKTGRFRVNPDVFFTAAQNSAIGSVIQQLYMEKNADSFVANVQQVFNNN
jgi:raffinose/stachyose/melibiose transport system substrate-binding protein